MNDDRFLHLAVEHRATRAEAKLLIEDVAKGLQDKLLAEIARRDCRITTSAGKIIGGFAKRGLKIMQLSQSITGYDVDKAKARLTPAVVRKLVRPVITKEAIDTALADGIITEEDVEAIATTTQSAPYVMTYGELTELVSA